MANWLVSLGIETVAMESTGIYWVPVFEMLESAGIEVILANAREAHAVPGRKSDVNDAQWIQRLHACGLLRASFRPEQNITALRTYLRLRDRFLEYAAAHIQHMQKALNYMNIQLHHVVSDVPGVTGMQMIRAIVQGERDPEYLARFRDVRCKASTEVVIKSLTGNYQPEHVFALEQALILYDAYQERILACDAQIERILAGLNQSKPLPKQPLPQTHKRSKQGNAINFDVRTALYQLTGVDLTQIHGIGPYLALRFIAECGTDFSKWRTAKHFTSWLTLSPGCKISGGKVLLGGENPGGKAGRGSENKVPFVAAVSVDARGRPVYARFTAIKGFTSTAIEGWARSTLDTECQVLTDGLPCFNGITDAGRSHAVIVAGGRKPRDLPKFWWVNTVLGNLKTGLSGAYHAFKFRKYAQRYLSTITYRFNRRFNLATLPMSLLRAAVNIGPRTERWLRTAESSC